MLQHIKEGEFKLHVSHFTTTIMVNVSHVLCCFIDCFLEQVFQKTWVCLLKVGIGLIVHNQNINKGHGLALTNIIVMK